MTFNGQGLTVGGESITITGDKFGQNEPGSGRYGVTIGGRPCTSYQVWTSTRIECMTPPGVGKDLAISVILGIHEAVAVETFTYLRPFITNLAPPHTPTSGTSAPTVTVVGQNFGSSCANVSGGDPAGTCDFAITIGASRCSKVLWWSDSSLACSVPPGVGAGLQVAVEAGGQTSTGGNNAFSYDAPVVTSLMPFTAPSQDPGLPITVFGRNFGTLPGAQVGVLIGSSSCKEVRWTSDTSVSCRLPEGFGTRLVSVSVAGNPSSSSTQVRFTYEGAPLIDRITPSPIPTSGGNAVTIWGNNFKEIGAEQVTVKVHTFDCPMLPSPRENTRVACVPPPLAGGPFDVTLRVGNRQTVSKEVLYIDAPVITEVLAAEGPLAVGAPVTIIGRNFGIIDPLAPPFGLELLIGTQVCPNTVWDSDTSIRCFVGVGGLESGPSMAKLRSRGRVWATQTFEVSEPSGKPSGLEVAIGVRSVGSSVELISMDTTRRDAEPKVLGAFLLGALDYGLTAADPMLGHVHVVSFAADGSLLLTTIDAATASIVSRVAVDVASALLGANRRRSLLSVSTGVLANLEFVPDQRSLVGVLADAGGGCLRTQVLTCAFMAMPLACLPRVRNQGVYPQFSHLCGKTHTFHMPYLSSL